MNKTILYCNRDSNCDPGIFWALRKMGCDPVFTERQLHNEEYDPEFVMLLEEQLQKTEADMVFSVNFAPVISRVCEKYHVPYLSWIIDSPVLHLYSDTLLHRCNYVFFFDAALYREFAHKNPGHLFYLPLGTDVEWFDGIEVTDEDHRLYDCDVSFVGSLYAGKYSYDAIAGKLPAYIRGFFDGVMSAQRLVYGYNFLRNVLTEGVLDPLRGQVTINQCEGYDIGQETLFWFLLNAKCTELERCHVLDAVSRKFSTDLYTGSDASMLKSIHVKGRVSPLDGMPKVFKCSRINLNLTAKGIQTGVPLRVYDVLGCGGFLISNYQSELEEQFEAGREIVLFESEEDLLEKIVYYLLHEEERLEIARRGYEKVRRQYTYEKRLGEMLRILENAHE